MRKFKLAVMILILLLLQTAAVSYIGVMGIVPDLVFAFVLAYAVVENEFTDNLVIALICGVLMSFFNGRGFLYTVLLYTYPALIVHSSYQKRKPFHRWVIPLITGILFTIIAEMVYYLIAFTAEISIVNAIEAIVYVVLPTAVYNAICIIIMYPIVNKLFSRERSKIMTVDIL